MCKQDRWEGRAVGVGDGVVDRKVSYVIVERHLLAIYHDSCLSLKKSTENDMVSRNRYSKNRPKIILNCSY